MLMILLTINIVHLGLLLGGVLLNPYQNVIVYCTITLIFIAHLHLYEQQCFHLQMDLLKSWQLNASRLIKEAIREENFNHRLERERQEND